MTLNYAIFKKVNDNVQMIEQSPYSQLHYKIGCESWEYAELCELFRYSHNHHVSYNDISKVYQRYTDNEDTKKIFEPMVKILEYGVVFDPDYLFFTIY